MIRPEVRKDREYGDARGWFLRDTETSAEQFGMQGAGGGGGPLWNTSIALKANPAAVENVTDKTTKSIPHDWQPAILSDNS